MGKSKLILLSLVTASVCQAQTTTRQFAYSSAFQPLAESAEWQRDVYREVDIMEWPNTGLYCPVDEIPEQQGLFMRLLTLAAGGDIPVYRYAIDGNEQFDDQSKADIREILASHYIPFTVSGDGNIALRREDVPVSDVMKYYVREGIYYDLSNSSFRNIVLAICPVLIQEDEFGAGKTQYPLFWVKYSDAEPYLRDVPVIPDYRNTAEVIPMSDYFTLNRYKGSIYKVSNAFGHTLAQQCGSDSIQGEQQRIERELAQVRENTYSVFSKPEPVVRKKKARRMKLPLFMRRWAGKGSRETAQDNGASAYARQKREQTGTAPENTTADEGGNESQQQQTEGK